MGDMLSQAEIDALLGGDSGEKASQEEKSIEDAATTDYILTDEQKDVLGEIGNITMGTSATTLFALMGEKVLITTPKVKVIKWKELAKSYDRPCVGISVSYKEGIEGSNVLILKQRDVKIISNLMLGLPGEEDVDGELTEIDLSAIAEAMNQMVGSSSTSLSSLVKMRIDIDTPHAFILDFNDDDFTKNVSFKDETIICIAFKMVIGKLIDSEIMQVLPIKFAEEMVDIMKNDIGIIKESNNKAQPIQQVPQQTAPAQQAPPPQMQQAPQQMQQAPPQYEAPKQQYYEAPQQQYIPPQGYYTAPQAPAYQQNVNVQPAQFQSFDVASVMQQKENIDIIMDVPLEVTVELGRTNKKIKEILEFSPGTIIELDKLAGDPIDILVNGKFVAKGEVVVIDENFGIRITDIINVEHRI